MNTASKQNGEHILGEIKIGEKGQIETRETRRQLDTREEQIRILYRDRYLLIAEKPVGCLSEKTQAGDDLISCLERQTGGYIGSVHRLDRTTGGVILLSCDPHVTGKLSQVIRERSVCKEYLAVLEGEPDMPEGLLEDLLFHDHVRNKVYVLNRERKGVRLASLAYKVLNSADTETGRRTLVCVRLHTGRTHQIRVQLASRRLPLVGDGKYGARDHQSPVAALWSYHIALSHPITGKPVEAYSPPPFTQYPWSLWQEYEDQRDFKGD